MEEALIKISVDFNILLLALQMNLEYQILLSIDLKFIELENGKKLLFQIEEIKKMLNGLIKKLNNADS